MALSFGTGGEGSGTVVFTGVVLYYSDVKAEERPVEECKIELRLFFSLPFPEGGRGTPGRRFHSPT